MSLDAEVRRELDSQARRQEKSEERVQELVVEFSSFEARFGEIIGAVQTVLKEVLVAVRGDGNGSRGALPRLNSLEYIVSTMSKTMSRQGVRLKAFDARISGLERELGKLGMVEKEVLEIKALIKRQGAVSPAERRERSKFQRAMLEIAKHAVTGALALLAAKYGLKQ